RQCESHRISKGSRAYNQLAPKSKGQGTQKFQFPRDSARVASGVAGGRKVAAKKKKKNGKKAATPSRGKRGQQARRPSSKSKRAAARKRRTTRATKKREEEPMPAAVLPIPTATFTF